MPTFISLLRGINVSGQKIIRMEELRGKYQALGLTNVRTYVQSGNVVFDSAETQRSALAARIEAAIEEAFGCSVHVFVFGAEDFRRIVSGNPFLQDANIDPSKLHITFFHAPLTKPDKTGLKLPDGIPDACRFGEQEVYVHCPEGYGRTKLSNAFFERKLKIPATTRNWKTVNLLFEMASRG